MNKVSERAGALGLFVTANALADAKIDPESAPRDARLTEPVAGDVKRILGQMARRGAEVGLIGALWSKLAGRPLEQALVAVDVLAQAVLPPREPLLGELRAAAALLEGARTAGELGVDLNAWPASALIERHARGLEGASVIELMARAYEQDLGALGELERRGDELVKKPATRESVHAFGRLAGLARLPTLASVYLDWLVRGLGFRAAAMDLCEVLFDAGMAHKLPGDAVRPGDVATRDQRDVAEYLLYRAHLSIGDTDTANALLMKAVGERARWQGPSARLDAVRAHLGTLYGHSDDVTLARVEAACTQDPLWRYGAQVRAILAARVAPAKAVEAFYGYLAGFGSHFESTLAVVSLVPEPVKREVARILCREAYYLPHEPAPWKLLGLLFGVGKPVADEVDARLRAQST